MKPEEYKRRFKHDKGYEETLRELEEHPDCDITPAEYSEYDLFHLLFAGKIESLEDVWDWVGANEMKRGAHPYGEMFDWIGKEGFVDYQRYIRESPVWKEKVKAAKYVAGYRCQQCHRREREKEPWDLHHMDMQEFADWKKEQRKNVVLNGNNIHDTQG